VLEDWTGRLAPAPRCRRPRGRYTARGRAGRSPSAREPLVLPTGCYVAEGRAARSAASRASQ
jgi:hypothetical protein